MRSKPRVHHQTSAKASNNQTIKFEHLRRKTEMGGSGVDLNVGNPQDIEGALPILALADRPPRKSSTKQ